LLFSVDSLPFPAAGQEQRTLDTFEHLCRQGDIAALLIEPLVLGAGGMRIYAPWVLTELKRIAETHGVLLIADEVMTGWGRTGSLFACEQAAITPDIMCLSKGLTGGAVPLAATMCTAEIFEAHLSDDRSRTFFHSSSYTANPIACAAACANLDIWRSEPVAERIATLAAGHGRRLDRFRSDPRFADLRQCGTIAVMEIAVPSGGYLSDAGPRLRTFFKARGLLIRPLGNVIYLMMPYCVTPDDLDRAYATIDEAVDLVAGDGR
jgi:adenosylmethionine-8-amino-7-oxononanoate aminotransferase